MVFSQLACFEEQSGSLSFCSIEKKVRRAFTDVDIVIHKLIIF